LLYQVCRFAAPKTFRQRRPDGKGGWIWKLGSTRRVLYRLPRVIEAAGAGEPVYIVEGEKDVHAMERAGAVATCNPGGAGKWKTSYNDYFGGADVVIVADRDPDERGRKHAHAIKQSLEGIAKTVRIVEAAQGKDAADHLAAGLDVDDFEEINTPEIEGEIPKPSQQRPARGTGELLDGVGNFLQRFVVLPSVHAVRAMSLWVLHSWAIAAAHATLYVVVISAERQSGKTRLLEVMGLLVREPWHTAGASESALFRRIEQIEPTLLLDEIDAIFGSNTERTEPLRAALNAGNRRGASVARCVGKGTGMTVVDFSVFCPKLLAGIDTGKLPETIQDRAVEIRMQRRRDGEHVERLRYRFAAEEVAPLRADLETWTAQAVDTLRDAVPELPDELSDRQADAWEPLFAIADLAGGEWPKRARDAALALSGERDEGASRGSLLLAAVRDAMGDSDVIATTDLLEKINANEELPFGGWSDGKGLDGRGLARLLKPYRIKRTTVRLGDRTAKGYKRASFKDAWARYLPSEGSQGKHGSHHPERDPGNPDETGDVTHVTQVTHVTGTEGDSAPANGNGHAELPDGWTLDQLEALAAEQEATA
jgi:5S rRNA maturation endonuclease (ribonuclease M5)